MQLTGDRFTSETAQLGNDISTLPNFPAEIRAPAGSLPGVSGFQIHFSDHDILTPGDNPHVLVAMNPAALRTNLRDLARGGTLIVNADAFSERNLEKAGYTVNPLEDGSLDEYQVHAVPLTSLTIEALKEFEVTKREAERSKNMFALGLMSWLFTRPTEGTIAFLEKKFASAPEIAKANIRAFQAGYAFGETSEAFTAHYEVKPAKLAPGTYRNVTGNQALRWDWWRRACRVGCRSSWVRIRSLPRPESSRSSRATSTSASGPSRPRTRSRRWARRSARPSAARSGYPRRAVRASS
jgi:2-oxoglutarate ferredoxin oxidoreductase subunit alpha